MTDAAEHREGDAGAVTDADVSDGGGSGRATDADVSDGGGCGRAAIRLADHPGDLGWIVMAHGEAYWDEWRWDVRFEALVAGIVADFAADHDPAREAAWIAEVAGERVGCIACIADDEPDTARLRILLVLPEGRGHGLGGGLVDTCIAFAREAGYRRLRLWTTSNLVAARRIYEARGFVLTHASPHTEVTAGVDDQTWELDLT